MTRGLQRAPMLRSPPIRRSSLLAIFTVVALLLGATATYVLRGRSGLQVTASSSARGSHVRALLSQEDGDAAAGGTTWRSRDETVGAWVRVRWDRARRVDHVRLVGGGAPGGGIRSALLTFDDGPAVLVSARSGPDLVADFPGREAREVQVTVATVAEGALSVGLGAVVLDADGGGVPPLTRRDEVRSSASSASDVARTALGDARPATGDAGAQWEADAGDDAPWAQLGWDAQRLVTSVQVMGPVGGAVDTGDTRTDLSGTLRFDDGSSVAVSGIAAGGGQPTTVSFAARAARSVHLDLVPGSPGQPVALRELRVFGAGTTPPRWPARDGGVRADPPRDDCTSAGAGAALGPAQDPDAVSLLCPDTGATVGDRARVVVSAPPGTALRASTSATGVADVAAPIQPVAVAVAGDDGRAVLDVDTSALPRGPFTVAVSRSEGTDVQPLHVQLLRDRGRRARPAGTAPAGMTLQWDDDFTAPVSASRTGADAVYAAAKPTPRGAEDFGDVPFAEPGDSHGAVATVGGDYLRLRAEHAPSGGADSAGGLLSSMHVGGSGFSAQYGYFEARILGAPGPGAWPAFWMLNSRSTTPDDRVVGEVDAVELYGHNTLGSCHSIHDYDPALDGGQRGTLRCLSVNGTSDWSVDWHVYGVRVVPDGAVYSIDGVEVARLRGLGRSEEPFFFLLDLALGGGWPVHLAATSGTTDMYVDWVRAYT